MLISPCRSYVLFLLLVPCLSCCAAQENQRHGQDWQKNYRPPSELVQADSELDTLDAETQKLKSSYEALEKELLQVASSSTDLSVDGPMLIQLNENNVIEVDGMTMSRNDFVKNMEKALPTRCQVTPTLRILSGANYDIAAWILEILYQNGCSNIEIK